MQKFVEQRLNALTRGDIVLLSSHLEYYFIQQKINREHHDRKLLFYDHTWSALSGETEALSLWIGAVADVARRTASRGILIAIMAPLPAFEGLEDNQTAILCEQEWFRLIPENCNRKDRLSTKRATLIQRYAAINTSLLDLARAHRNIQIINPFNHLCPPSLERCSSSLEGITQLSDDDHLSEAGALRLKPLLLKLIHRFPVSAIKPGVDQMAGNVRQ